LEIGEFFEDSLQGFLQVCNRKKGLGFSRPSLTGIHGDRDNAFIPKTSRQLARMDNVTLLESSAPDHNAETIV
jgi:hypothetical protein